MVDFVKKKIVEKLAKFTKHLKPSDISLSFLSGKGHLSNLELNGEVISAALQLPPWVVVSRVVCDTIRAKVPFTNINTDPVNFYIGQVLIEISTTTNTTTTGSNTSSSTLLKQLGGNPSKYSLIDKVIDGMQVEVRSVLVFLKDPLFHAQLEMTDILIQSTSCEWKVVPLSKARVRNEDEDSIINYKMCSWSSLKIEGWSIAQDDNPTSHNQLRLIVGTSKIYVSFKRNMSDSSIMCSRIVIDLGDLIWILTQSQLRAVSRLTQTLMDAAVRTQQVQREGEEADSQDSEASFESTSSERSSHKSATGTHDSKVEENKKAKKPKKRKSKSSIQKDKVLQERISQYREGKVNLPSYEVIQNSFHLKTGKVDLQLCDDIGNSGVTDTVQGSMLIQVFHLAVDLYLDQPAGLGRAHWNKANDIIDRNTKWSRKLITAASKTQFLDLPSVNLAYLRERDVVIRCSDFSVGALRNGVKTEVASDKQTLPIITSDKTTFNIPDDDHNPALQVGVTLYFYPDKCGKKFLVPRPNVLLYMSPVHVNVHQESCLWLVEFVHGVVKTVNVELALSVKDEGKSFLEEIEAQKSVQVEKLPGVDMKVKILFTKVTLPLSGASNDGRPKALQIETAAIKVKNSPLNELLNDSHFSEALQVVKKGWLFSSQDTQQFPHYQGDLRALPVRLQELLHQQVRAGRRRGESGSEDSDSPNPSSTGLAPEVNRAEMVAREGWHVSTSCVHVAFASNYTHKATLHTKTFMDDFPVHLWLFLPPSSLDSSFHSSPISTTPPTTPTTSQPSLLKEPRFSIIAHVPSEIRVELERLQLLFIMRLKDSFTSFKTSLMKFLDPNSFAPHLKETLAAHKLASKEADMEPTTPPVTIGGCIALHSVEVSILLPTLYTSRTSSQATNVEYGSHDRQVRSPDQRSTTPSSSSRAVTPSQTNPHLEEAVTTGTTSDMDRPHPHSHAPSPGPSPKASPISTRASLTSLPCSTLTESKTTCSPNTSQVSLIGRTSPSGSLASLPIILEAGDLAVKSRGTYASTSNLLSGQGHTLKARSLSAVELLPLQGSEGKVVYSSADLTTYQDNRNPSKLGSEQDDFVMVKFPTTSPPQDRDKVPHPVSNPSVLIEKPHTRQSSSDVSHPPATGSCPSILSLSPSPLSPMMSPTPSDRSTRARRAKSPAPLRTVPQFVLHISVHKIFALPNIKTGEIAAKVSAGSISLRELSTREYEGMKELKKRRTNSDMAPPPNSVPSIKARFEVGDQVGRFYPSNGECAAQEQDVILIAKIEGLDLSLLLPNITIMKDFFDDEYESLLPLPLHLKVATTRAVLLEDLAHGTDHAQSVEVGVEQLEVHRGRELAHGVDIFLEESGNAISRCDNAVVASSSEHTQNEADDQLLSSFSDFISVFEAHVQHHGRVHLPQPHHIAELLQELQVSLLPVKPSVSPPPTYTEVAPYSYLHSSNRRSSTELLHLRRQNEQLRQVQRQCERMSAQLKESQVEMERRESDLLMVTDECKRTKDQLVSYKQVMEKQQEHIEKLLTENFDLQRQLLLPHDN